MSESSSWRTPLDPPPQAGRAASDQLDAGKHQRPGVDLGKPVEVPWADRHGTGLCLSGGGFRAAMFHLGSTRRLDELGILGRLRTVSGVSGGSIIANLLHFGRVTLGLPYSFQGQMRLDEVTGGSPYGPTHWSGLDGDKPISEDEKRLAVAMGKRLAETALKLGAR